MFVFTGISLHIHASNGVVCGKERTATIFRSSHSQMFFKKDVLKILAMFFIDLLA